jgi:hypothetical protein
MLGRSLPTLIRVKVPNLLGFQVSYIQERKFLEVFFFNSNESVENMKKTWTDEDQHVN